MQETAQQYTKRILGYQKAMVPITVLSSSPRRIASLVQRVSRKQIMTRPAKNRWSAAEILAHLADAELVFSFRLRLVLGLNRVRIQAYDQNVWAEYSRYRKLDPTLSLNSYRVLRQRNVRLLRSLPRKMWQRYGMHEERGKETVVRMTEMMAGHDINHIQQLKGLLRKQGR